jgi:hypothetical protein
MVLNVGLGLVQWSLEFWGGCHIFGILVHPWCRRSVRRDVVSDIAMITFTNGRRLEPPTGGEYSNWQNEGIPHCRRPHRPCDLFPWRQGNYCDAGVGCVTGHLQALWRAYSVITVGVIRVVKVERLDDTHNNEYLFFVRGVVASLVSILSHLVLETSTVETLVPHMRDMHTVRIQNIVFYVFRQQGYVLRNLRPSPYHMPRISLFYHFDSYGIYFSLQAGKIVFRVVLQDIYWEWVLIACKETSRGVESGCRTYW